MALDSHPRNAAVAENLLVPDGRLVIIVTSTPFVRESLESYDSCACENQEKCWS